MILFGQTWSILDGLYNLYMWSSPNFWSDSDLQQLNSYSLGQFSFATNHRRHQYPSLSFFRRRCRAAAHYFAMFARRSSNAKNFSSAKPSNHPTDGPTHEPIPSAVRSWVLSSSILILPRSRRSASRRGSRLSKTSIQRTYNDEPNVDN